MNKKAIRLLKGNWKSIVVGIFMIFVTTKLIQIERNTEAIYEVEWTLSSVEADVSQILKKLGR